MRKKPSKSEPQPPSGPPGCFRAPLAEEVPLGLRIVMKAREYLGTPFFHAGRQKGLGVDCIGLILCVAHELELTDYDDHNYQASNIDTEYLRAQIERFGKPVDKQQLEDGDVIVFSIQGRPQHVGIFTTVPPTGTVIHADESSGRVVEDFYDRKLRLQVAYCYRWDEERWPVSH